METSILEELLCDILPHWIGRFEKYIPKADKASEALIITPASTDTPPMGIKKDAAMVMSSVPAQGQTSPGSSTLRISGGSNTAHEIPDKAKAGAAHESKLLTGFHCMSRLHAKPNGNKSRFSSMSEPAVYYDGESQQMLCDFWTAINSKRGGLRREMMTLKRRQHAQSTSPGSVAELGDANRRSDDGDGDRASEMIRLRLKMEREKLKRMKRRAGTPMSTGPMPYNRAMSGESRPVRRPSAANKKIDDKALKKLLQVTDDNFDNVCKVAETAAFVWLKGEAYENHLEFIVEKLRDTARRIEKSGLMDKPEEKEKDKEVDKTMNPPPIPQPRLELASRKGDITMKEADPPLLQTSSPGAAVLIPSDASFEESRAPSLDSTIPEAQPRQDGPTKWAELSPAEFPCPC